MEKEQQKIQKEQKKIEKEKEKLRIKEEADSIKENNRKLKEERKKKIPELTDEHIALTFLSKIDDDLLYDKKLQRFYLFNYDNLLWEEVFFEVISTMFSDFIIQFIDDEILMCDDAIKIEKFEEYKIKICSTRTHKDVLFQVKNRLKDSSKFIEDNFNYAVTLFPFGNYVYDFSTGSSRLRVKEDYFTITTTNVYKHDYNNEWIQQYIRELLMTDDQKYVDSFLFILSFFLTNNNSMKKLLILLGPSDSGKSGILALISIIMGDFYVPAPKRLFIQGKSESVLQTELPPLIFKRLSGISELKDTETFNEDLMKRISGDDRTINCRTQNVYNVIKILAKLLIISNEMPNTKDPVLLNRFIYVNFKNKFEKSDKKKKEIESMSDDFFSCLCHYATKLVSNEFKVDIAPQMIDYKNEVLEDRPSTSKDFCSTCLDFTNDFKNDRIKKLRLYNIYLSYCINKGLDKETKVEFYKELSMEPFNLSKATNRIIKTMGEEFFTGIKMKSNWNDDEEEINERLL